MTETIDYGEDANRELGGTSNNTGDTLVRLRVLAERQIDEEREVERIEALLKLAQAKLRQTCVVEIPTLMDEVGVPSFTMKDGRVVKLTESIQASIPKDGERTPDALAWLIRKGHGGVIRTVVAVALPVGREEQVLKAQRALEMLGLSPDTQRGVHHSTLSALARELLTNGKEIDMELLGVTRLRQSKIDDKAKDKKSKPRN